MIETQDRLDALNKIIKGTVQVMPYQYGFVVLKPHMADKFFVLPEQITREDAYFYSNDINAVHSFLEGMIVGVKLEGG